MHHLPKTLRITDKNNYSMCGQVLHPAYNGILAEGAIALSVTLSGGALFAS
tara:strand:- start:319 stop:471 length:153 start_codon:yes stop_codon:yes gene_type:complete